MRIPWTNLSPKVGQLCLALGALGQLTSTAAAETAPCLDRFRQVGLLDLYQDARREKAKAVAGVIAKANTALKAKIQEIWREDYLGAWRSGATVPEKTRRFLLRTLAAPRSRAKDPALREAELRKFQFLRLLDPLGEGIIEGISKGRVALGKPPLQSTLSIPAGIALAVPTTIALSAIFEGAQEAKLAPHLAQDKIGMAYTAAWAEMSEVPLQEAVAFFNEHNAFLARWLKEVDGNHPGRMLPPRFYQFLMLGLLRGPAEISALEGIAIDVLRENQARIAQKLESTGDAFVREEIIRRLREQSLFHRKTKEELALLAMVFEPPFLLGSKTPSLAWVDQVRRGFLEPYKLQVMRHSDIHWLHSTLPGKENESVGKTLGPNPSPLKAKFAYLQGYSENKRAISAKKIELAGITGFPGAKDYLGKRIDLPAFVTPPVPWLTKAGELTELEREIDYWRLLIEHPAFKNIRERWESGAIDDSEAIAQLRGRMAGLTMLYAAQEDELALARKADPKRSFPPDILPDEYCQVRKTIPLLETEITGWRAAMDRIPDSSKNYCDYLVAVDIWRLYAWKQLHWREPTQLDPKKFGEVQEKWFARTQARCQATPAALAKAAGELGFKTAGEMEQAFACSAKPGGR